MPFTLRNLKADLEDVEDPGFDGAPDLEFRLATDALELEQSGLSYPGAPSPPGYRFPYGHTHKTQEEVFVVLRGSGRIKLRRRDRRAQGGSRDAGARAGPHHRYVGVGAAEAGPEGLVFEIIVIGAPSLGDGRREDVEGQLGLIRLE